jgi:hypothetical protein
MKNVMETKTLTIMPEKNRRQVSGWKTPDGSMIPQRILTNSVVTTDDQ